MLPPEPQTNDPRREALHELRTNVARLPVKDLVIPGFGRTKYISRHHVLKFIDELLSQPTDILTPPLRNILHRID